MLAWLLGGTCIVSTVANGQPMSGDSPQARSGSAGLAPFETVDRIIYVQGTIDGSRPLWFLISSGSPGSVLDSAVAAELRLSGGASVTASVGGADIRLVRLSTLDLSQAEDQLGHEVDGVIGYELFDRYVVEIDHYGEILRLHEPSTYGWDSRMAQLPLRVDRRLAYVDATVELAGHPRLRRSYRLDTGIGGAVIDDRVRSTTSKKLEIAGDVQGTPFSIVLTRARWVAIGPFRFEGANGISGDTAIGGELLRRFTTVIDYSRGRLGLLPNRHYDDRFCFEMLGVELSVGREAGALRVDAVYRNSTAERSGIRVGDLLIAIDGRLAASIPLGQVRMMFGQQNSYVLTLNRGDSTRLVAVKLTPSL